MQQFLSQQSNAATSATQLQQGQDVVVNALQQKFKSSSGVNIDTEMASLISLQNTYAANARVMSVVQTMMTSLMQVQFVRLSIWQSTASVTAPLFSISRC